MSVFQNLMVLSCVPPPDAITPCYSHPGEEVKSICTCIYMHDRSLRHSVYIQSTRSREQSVVGSNPT